MQPQGVQIFNPIILAMAFPHTVPLKGTDPILTVVNTQFPSLMIYFSRNFWEAS